MRDRLCPVAIFWMVSGCFSDTTTPGTGSSTEPTATSGETGDMTSSPTTGVDSCGSSTSGSTTNVDTTTGDPPAAFCEDLPRSKDLVACFDFDGDDPLAEWGATENGGGMVSLETDTPHSPPRLLRTRVEGGSQGSVIAAAGVVMDLPEPLRVRLAGRVRHSEGCLGAPYTRMYGIAYFDQSVLQYSAVLAVADAQLVVEESGMNGLIEAHPVGPVADLGDGQWHDVRLAVNAVTAEAAVIINGVPAGTVALQHADTIPPGISPLVSFGQLRTVDNANPCSVDFDSIVVRTIP